MKHSALNQAYLVILREQQRIHRRNNLTIAACVAVLATYLLLWAMSLAGFAYWMWTLAQ